ncbi:rod shape-determining protein [Spiroplasma turonicum]|uniref:Cell shape-determining protein MreB n=1 Tax=Spiroplasma turonicum TaxID=216946 RepID=A0A0K1P7N5_9MOLU|nr:rod shape-determining protein [Spiroplasma turonicum]AKU80326.1 cell shape determining protein MreB [Spiroplasma turonicum]ALX71327.1 cell shape determining protein MreB [Spiroplasma turonicum]
MKLDERTFIALDLGTSNIIAYVSKQGIVYNEPSIMAYDTVTNSLLALGEEAYAMLGKTHETISMIVPIKDGVITDLDAAKDMLKHVFGKLKMLNDWRNSIILLACPSEVTELEREALKQVAYDMGAEIVVVEEEVKMAAIGAGINIDIPKGNIVIDIGGGTSDIAILSAGDIIISRSIKVAGNAFNEEIKKYVRSEYNVTIGDKTAENVKKELGSLAKYKGEKTMSVFGRDIVSGLPKEAIISSEEIRNVLVNAFSRITDMVIEIMENTPPELAGDIISNGFMLCGGGALIRGIKEYFNGIFSIPCKISPSPMTGVVEGAQIYQKVINRRIENGYYGKNAKDLRKSGQSQYI